MSLTRAGRSSTKTSLPAPGSAAGPPPARSTMNRMGAPWVLRASFVAEIAASTSSCDVTAPLPTATMRSPTLQPSPSASGRVSLVTVRSSIRSPMERSSPKSSATTMATLCCLTPAPLAIQSSVSLTPPAMPSTALDTRPPTMSAASCMPSLTAFTTPLSLKSLAVPSSPSSTASTTALTPPPTSSTASSAVSAKRSPARLAIPSLSVTRPTPPIAAPPTNFGASPTARPPSWNTPLLLCCSGVNQTSDGGCGRCSADSSHSSGLCPRTAACRRLWAESSAALAARPSGTASLKRGTRSPQSSSR
mmetsp:Transcript_103073/g.291978  ORF Transcript_103073/g.291978 Transcript_103073/m.291978 type:complete len:305 (-) Transcript_103073:569-1483(-)